MLREEQAAREIGLNKSSAADLFVANDGAGVVRPRWFSLKVAACGRARLRCVLACGLRGFVECLYS
jgi:hypothetical protein